MGRKVPLNPIGRNSLKGISIGDLVSYQFYEGDWQGHSYVFALPQGKASSPGTLSATAHKLYELTDKDTVFIFQSCPTYLRQRLIDKGVYFVVSDKFAFLPNLLINERISEKKKAQRLTPVAQYLLLYHQQVMSIEGKSAREIAELVPYSYQSVTFGLVCLEDLGLISRSTGSDKSKAISWSLQGRELFDKAEPLMLNPVQRMIFCDELITDESFPTSGINALSHYSRLVPDKEKTLAVSPETYKRLQTSSSLIGENPYDGKYRIEVWKYPPVTADGYAGQWVDPLSLFISLKNDNDPRVENEVESMINHIEWKD